jgi:peptide chain release factor 1
MDVLDCWSGLVILRISGNNPLSVFKNEAGGHRWQRVPPNEKNGRVHTSTITVSVLEEAKLNEIHISNKDLEIKTCRGSGKGGQNRNKRNTTVQIKHIPTNIFVRCENERSQYQNRQVATNLLKIRLYNHSRNDDLSNINNIRKQQIGSGMRGDKRRTVYVQHNIVKDHVTDKTWTYKNYIDGEW